MKFLSPSLSSVLRTLSSVALASAALFLAGCGKDADKKTATADKPAAGAPGLATDDQKVSYGLGYNMGKNVAAQNAFTVDREALKAGLDDGLSGGKLKIADADLEKAFQAIQQKAQAAAAVEGQKQLAAGADFLAKNKSNPGVKTTASGLQYQVLKSGGGPKVKATDTVEVAYHGTLIDGTVFDSSVERGDTATFAVNQVVPGWTEALQLMAVGDKFKLWLPSNLGYGAHARGKIPANAVLVFEVEIKQIK
jgi:FKBP-type peptidyl-prolyl cis-trans isomerase FklB